MSGKFNNISSGICIAYCLTIVPLVTIGGIVVCSVISAGTGLAVFTTFVLLGLMLLVLIPLGKCEFTADDEKVVFRVAFIKRTYRYSEIRSASTEIGFYGGKYAAPRVELVLNLSEEEHAKFCDTNVPRDVFSTPEDHKAFHDTHQFTALCRFINERACAKW